MKNKIYLLFLVLGVLYTFSACNDELEIEPPTDITPEQYLWDASQLQSYCVNLYPSILPSHGNWSFGVFGYDAATDNMAIPSYENKFAPGQWKVGQTDGEWKFTNICQCNYFLSTVLPRWKAGEISGNTDLVNHYIGEMYFLRAYEYFTRVQALGDFPIVRTVFADDKEALTAASKRAPHSEVVRFIISDLDSAITLLQAKSPDGKNNQLSKACAQLVKSRVALYEATWLKYFKNTAFVPNGSGWPGAAKDYNKNYQYQAGSIDAEIEWLLGQAMEASAAVADNYTLTTNNKILQQKESDGSNPYFNMFSAEDMSSFSEVLLWRQYSKSLGVVHNVPVYAQLGNYAVGLTRGMVDGFLMANGLPIYATGSGYAGDDYISSVRENRDGRLWLFLKEPGQINCFKNVNEGDHATAVEPYPDITNSAWDKGYSTGYTIRKGLNYDGIYADNGSGYTGCVVFRATEAYLNYMEACYEKNGSLDSKAKQYWISIRTRAGVDTDFDKTIAATNMTEEAKNDWGSYSAGSLIDPTLYNIRRERRCELMAEGFREMDIRRWRAMDQMISTPYHIEGFKLWGPMKDWYSANNLTYGTSTSTVSNPATSAYLRIYEKTGNELVYAGYKWNMAHYWDPIAAEHFLITSQNNDVSTSPIYQNPGWPTTANQGPTN
ncbi:MAG TPA: RagB/SusD family nutrient uptake outer membrane protein [Bacteroidales bacterium]|nr:RagB/SusD family nutrient uptake outer membrane protein [Bacteroidales bacterium]